MNVKFQSDLKEAWKLRNSQQIEAAEAALRRMRSVSVPLKKMEEIELQILEASFLRARNEIVTSDGLLMGVKERLEKESLSTPAQYFLQRGLNLFYQGYFPSALEFFAKCQTLTEEADILAMAIGNHFVCLDILNLPSEKIVQRLKDLRPQLTAEYYNQAVAPPLKTFECKQAFRQGRIDDLFHTSQEAQLGQSEYFQLWVSQLPYVEGSLCQSDVSRLLETPHLIWKKFRIHTLMAEVRYEDLDIKPAETKVSEHVDRLYLWLWKWMTAPEKMDAVAVESCWHSLDPVRVCNHSTAEDLTLLKLCLRWCRLFDPRWEVPSEEWMKKSLPANLQESPLFSFEGKVLDYVEALKRKDASDATRKLKTLRQDPLYKNRRLRFADLIEGLCGEPGDGTAMRILGQRLAQKFNPEKGRSKVSARILYVDLAINRWKKGKEDGVSAPLCRLINALLHSDGLSFSDVMKTCFDFQFYDEDLHRNKVMNLLTRARKILPAKSKLFTRQQRIYLQFSHGEVVIHSSQPLQAKWQLPPIFARPCIQQNQFYIDRWIQPRLLIKNLNGHNEVTRQNIQEMFRISKATANRLLKRWTEEGFLEKREVGRAVRYLVDNRYFSRLKNRDS